ncbi:MULTISPECIES: restriction endonuclease subunit S [Flavobacteriaceae]|uniref:restriction endonuclease subunit S n=1 Tax=Flavobacteriaceae TaxID=49546 RepID=UPI003A916274
MKKYNEYKDSGIEWLGLLPSDWESIRIDWCSEMVRGNTALKKDELLPEGDYIALQYGKTYKVDEVDNKFQFYVNKELYKKGQLVNFGDTILISTSETLEDLGHSCFYNRIDLGLLGGEQILLQPKSKIIIEKYLFFYSKFFCLELRKYATGLKVFRFNIDDLKNIFIPIPPLKEQTQIANYLDAKTTLIDKKVSLLQQKIKHYKAYRKSLINETVTKGLDKSVIFKDSGIDWIGEIPENWEVKRLKDVSKIFTGNSISDKSMFETKKDSFDYIATKDINIHNKKVNYDNGVYIPKKDKSFKITKKNTSLICLEGASAGNKLTFVDKEVAFVNKLCAIKSSNKNVFDKYIFYQLQSNLFRNQFFELLSGLIGGVSLGLLKYFNVVIPSKTEQQQIANYLDNKTATIDKIVNNIETQINTLKELRKTLINEVVTGKVKVS